MPTISPLGEPLLIDTGYRITNGPAFDLASCRMYHTDSPRQSIFRFDVDDEGEVGEKRLFAQFDNKHGYPDGMTVDAKDCL